VTVLEATADVDGGAVWATRNFDVRDTAKSSLYRHEVRRGAIEGLLEALGKLELGIRPEPLDPADPRVIGRERPLIRQPERSIDWKADPTETVIRASARPMGIPACSTGWGAGSSSISSARTREPAPRPAGRDRRHPPRRDLLRDRRRRGLDHATSRRPDGFKLPAVRALALAGVVLDVPEVPAPPTGETFREIRYEERDGVGYLHFDFYNGAMSVDPVPPAAPGLSRRDRPRHQGPRADGRRGLLLQRHPPQRDRGGRRPGAGVLRQPGRDRRRRPRDPRDRVAHRDLGAAGRRGRRRRAVRARRRPRGSRASTWS
jgi:hypothetical protein